jgi:predicted O-methyltransferase YrrM
MNMQERIASRQVLSEGGTRTRIVTISRDEFSSRFGSPDTSDALCGFTCPADTHVVLALLKFAQPQHVLEIGTGTGQMTANISEWTKDSAQVYTMSIVHGVAGALFGAKQQAVETPSRADFGRFANRFGKIHKIFFIVGDSVTYDFRRLAPLDFVFVDGGHDFETVCIDSRNAFDALAQGGWLVWHDFNSPVPWVRVRDAVEQLRFLEPVVHVKDTEVAFVRKGAPGFPVEFRAG